VGGNLSASTSKRSDPACAVLGSREWSERVLELIERDCMDDFEELCVLMGVPTEAHQRASVRK